MTREEFAADGPPLHDSFRRLTSNGRCSRRGSFSEACPGKAICAAAFDSLQLRQALAETFSATGTEGEDIWRAAAKVRTLLLQSDAPEPRDFWNDGDVRWLAGIHESDGVTWVTRKSSKN